MIRTPRLRLVSLSPAFLRAALEGRLGEAALLIGGQLPEGWPGADAGVLRRRLEQLEADPSEQPWLLRGMLLSTDRTLVGLVGFHARPRDGTVEIGYRVNPQHRRQGYAEEAVRALLGWAHAQGVQRCLASVSPTNEPSLSLVRKLGFGHTGSQWDEEDGLELVFELDGLATAQPMRPYTPHDTN